MQTERTNRKLSITFWVLTVVCMGVIFFFSSRTAEESSEQSRWFVNLFIKLFGDSTVTQFAIRKLAHFLEFAGLCFLFNSSFYFTKNKKCFWQSILCTSAYAITDEVHQIFVEGRSCQFTDWCIDTLGAVAGAIGFAAVFYIFKLNVDNRKKLS